MFFDLEGDPFVRGSSTSGAGRRRTRYACAVGARRGSRAGARSSASWPSCTSAWRATPGCTSTTTPPTRSRRCARSRRCYATCEEEVDELLRREVLVDLYAVVRQGLQVGEESYSIKALERHYGFVRAEQSIREGGGSIVAYEAWLEGGDAALLEAIRAYNEDDCRSTLALRDWLWGRDAPRGRRRSSASTSRRCASPRRRSPSRRPPGSRSEVRGARRAAATTTERARCSRYLLLYHRREGKPAWWRYFDLRGKTPEELVEERDAIGLLALDRTVPPRRVKRSLAWTLRFPPQEFRLGSGGAEDPTTGEQVQRASRSRTTTSCSHAGRGEPPPEPARADRRRPDGVRRAARRAASRSASRCSPATAASPPPARCCAAIPPSRSADPGSLVDGHARARWRGAAGPGPARHRQDVPRRADDRRRAARRDGAWGSPRRATPRSRTCSRGRAPRARVRRRFAGVYKGEGYDGDVDDRTDDNAVVPAEHQLVAGTAWLFARPEHREAFDLLFVDEAGQYSLADAVAVALAARQRSSCSATRSSSRRSPRPRTRTARARRCSSTCSTADATIPPDRGVLLDETWRMHPDVCAFVSERSYEGRLHSRTACARDASSASGR